jgi:D-sedoheptulose 7-phosphate isomerase
MNKEIMKAQINKYIKESNSVSLKTIDISDEKIIEASFLLSKSLKSNNKIMICGNGGSSSDASHLAAEFTNKFSSNLLRSGLAAISLSVDSTFITAHSNDFSFDTIFSRQIESLGLENDILIVITTSGKSENILKALKQANKMGIKSIALTGNNNNLNQLASLTINIESDNTQHIQESMLKIEHLLIHFVEQIIYKP